MTVITCSRQLGSYGEEIAAGLAQALGQRLIDAETINRAAHKAGVPEMALAELQNEGERGLATQVLKALRTMPGLTSTSPYETPLPREEGVSYSDVHGLRFPFGGLFSPTLPPISASLESYVQMVGLVIRGLAQEGNVLIVGRGGQALLRDHPGALHVQIVAPFAQRCEVVMARLDLDRRAAQNRVRASDRARSDYLRRYHDRDWLDSTQYHLVLNTGKVPPARAVELIISAQQAILQPNNSDEGNE
jgi:cytidylate kinase